MKSAVMASELFLEDSLTAACPIKRAHEDIYIEFGVAMPPAKRQNMGVVGEKQVKDDTPRPSAASSHDIPFIEEDGHLPGQEGEPLKAKDGRGNVGNETGGANLDGQGNLEIVSADEQLSQQTHQKMSCTSGSLNCELGDVDVDNGPVLAAGATAAVEEERVSSDSPCSDGSAADEEECKSPGSPSSDGSAADEEERESSDSPCSDGSAADEEERESSDSPCSDGSAADDSVHLELPRSVCQRQQEDPDLKEKIHKVETNYWSGKISRDVYNEERFNLFTEEEREKAHIAWPRRPELRSPAGYRSQILESWNYRGDGKRLDDEAYQFGVPLRSKGKAAKKRLKHKIEAQFEDLEARRAEFERWKKIRKVETQYYDERISRGVYNKRRFPLYTEAEREEKGIIPVRCYSPAGFRDAVFEQYRMSVPEWQTRMDFHGPFASSSGDSSDEENLCEFCVHLIEEAAKEKEAEMVRRLELRAKKEAAREEEKMKRKAEWEKRRRGEKLNGKRRRRGDKLQRTKRQ